MAARVSAYQSDSGKEEHTTCRFREDCSDHVGGNGVSSLTDVERITAKQAARPAGVDKDSLIAWEIDGRKPQ